MFEMNYYYFHRFSWEKNTLKQAQRRAAAETVARKRTFYTLDE